MIITFAASLQVRQPIESRLVRLVLNNVLDMSQRHKHMF